jgi:hypothetical protein
MKNLRDAAERVIEAAPEAQRAISSAMDRLNAPFHVRLWHQWKGHEGWGHGYWGCGSELDLAVVISIVAIVVTMLILWSIQ